jgi:hypothetical protein
VTFQRPACQWQKAVKEVSCSLLMTVDLFLVVDRGRHTATEVELVVPPVEAGNPFPQLGLVHGGRFTQFMEGSE